MEEPASPSPMSAALWSPDGLALVVVSVTGEPGAFLDAVSLLQRHGYYRADVAVTGSLSEPRPDGDC